MARRIWPLIAVLACLTASPLAFGFVVLEEHFDSDLPNFASNSAWERGYCSDNWRTDMNGGVVANRDDGCDGCDCNFFVQTIGGNSCIDSDPFDNHIRTGNKYWQNYEYSVKFRNADDDSIGVVFRFVDPSTFYLFLLTRQESPAFLSGCEVEFNGGRLLRVATGVVEELKSVEGFTYTPGTVHKIRIIAVLNHIKVEFDKDGDGSFGDGEVFFDADDEKATAIPAGMVGLYSYENGVQGNAEAPPCANKGCWFDDVTVDLLPPNDDGCENVAWEGICDGNSLQFCDKTGQLKIGECQVNYCCRWAPDEAFYTCVKGAQCGSNCTDSCQQGQKGCSANLSHTFTCGQGDDDSCLEPVFAPCPENTVCNPASGNCESVCTPDCTGQECGSDGCGGECGLCQDGATCIGGKCKVSGSGQLGDPCESGTDCILGMCVETEVGKICTKACTGTAPCPLDFDCVEVELSGIPVYVCVPTGTCQPVCTGKECGDDGCGGSCGSCPAGFTCKGTVCKANAGATCEEHSECATSLCVHFQSGTYCTSPCSTDEGCLEGWECSPWLSALTPNICAPPGTMVAHELCSEVAACVQGCPGGNTACYSNCFFLGSDEAKEEYAAMFVCAELYCFAQCEDVEGCVSECLLDECFQEFAVCYPGTKSCKHALDCIFDCSGNEICMGQCYDDALPAAKKQIVELLDCIGELCEEGSGAGCLAAALGGPCKEPYENCTSQCDPLCGTDECGDDGCGGTCGSCPEHHECKNGKCEVVCVPACDDKDCGDDGCGGVCGACADGLACQEGECIEEPECEPHAFKKCVDDVQLFWFDSCGNQEGLAEECELSCIDDHCHTPHETSDIVSSPDDSGFVGGQADPIVMSAKLPDSGGCGTITEKGAGVDLAGLALVVLFGLAAPMVLRWRRRKNV